MNAEPFGGSVQVLARVSWSLGNTGRPIAILSFGHRGRLYFRISYVPSCGKLSDKQQIRGGGEGLF